MSTPKAEYSRTIACVNDVSVSYHIMLAYSTFRKVRYIIDVSVYVLIYVEACANKRAMSQQIARIVQAKHIRTYVAYSVVER